MNQSSKWDLSTYKSEFIKEFVWLCSTEKIECDEAWDPINFGEYVRGTNFEDNLWNLLLDFYREMKKDGIEV